MCDMGGCGLWTVGCDCVAAAAVLCCKITSWVGGGEGIICFLVLVVLPLLVSLWKEDGPSFDMFLQMGKYIPFTVSLIHSIQC